MNDQLREDPMITMEQADEMVLFSQYSDLVEDYEFNELGHVYTLVDGTAIVVSEDGIQHVTD